MGGEAGTPFEGGVFKVHFDFRCNHLIILILQLLSELPQQSTQDHCCHTNLESQDQ
jgi:hypothetical protein